VFIVADIRLYRDGLAHVLQRRRGIHIVGAAADAHGAAEVLQVRAVDVLLLDMAAPNALQTLRFLLALPSAPRIVALSVPATESDLIACAEAGVSGYVTRDDSLDTMIAAIESVARGELLTTPRMAAALFERLHAVRAAETSEGAATLTRRELEVVDLIAEGLSNKAIARQLSIELSTVKNHVHNILEKLHVERRTDAAARLRQPVSMQN
jgi:DNA-binding NarL/FixJ family response regulator